MRTSRKIKPAPGRYNRANSSTVEQRLQLRCTGPVRSEPSFGTIFLTGVVNVWFLSGPAKIPTLAVNIYGQLLITKLGLFAVMLGIASLNRFRLTPALERSIEVGDHRGALGLLRRSLAAETGCALAILGLLAWLGVLEPPASM